MNDDILLRGYQGLGDQFYQRPFIRRFCEAREGTVYLETPYPELYAGLGENLRFVRSGSGLRCQAEHERGVARGTWSTPPPGVETRILGYGIEHFRRLGTDVPPRTFAEQLGVERQGADWSFTPPDAWRDTARAMAGDGPYALVRPLTVRKDWPNPARNCLPEYLERAVERCIRAGLRIVSVADIRPGEARVGRPLVGFGARQGERAGDVFLDGGVPLETLMGLISEAHMVISAVGFALPAAASMVIPMLCVFGGYTPPASIIAPDWHSVIAVAPEPCCDCLDQEHVCPKDIDPERLDAAIEDALAMALGG